jgi:hemoglobin
MLALAGVCRAQADAPLERKALDQRVYAVLREVINRGADLYNEPVNDRAGCYRLYQGSLLTLRPLLDHRPEQQKAIDEGLAEAERQPTPGESAFVLRRVMDRLRADVRPDAKTTLWDRLGGQKGVAKVVDDFVALAAQNPKVDFTRGGKFKLDDAAVADLKKKLVEFVSAATGGPLKYTGKDMKEVHKGMGITDEQFDAAAADLTKALEQNKVKAEDAQALLKIVETTRKEIVEPKPADDKKP